MPMHLLPRLFLVSIALAAAACDALPGEPRQTTLSADATDAASPEVSADMPPDASPASTPEPAPGETKPFEFGDGKRVAAASGACQLPGFSMPANARIYAAGAYAGAPTNFQIDGSGHEATTIKVAVNETAAPVVLMLGAYEPTVWSVGWTHGTRIVGVLVTGYHHQQITGLAPKVPVLVSTYENRGPCGYAYVGGDGSSKLNDVARKAFGRAVDTAFAARNGQVLVGAPGDTGSLVTDASARDAADFRRKDAPLAGEAGLDAAVAAGVLRPATQRDAEEWERVRRAHAGPDDVPPIVGAPERTVSVPHNGYVVLKPFQIPAGLYGAHSATFMVARGVTMPTGNPGHSRVLDFNTGQCSGLTCGFDR